VSGSRNAGPVLAATGIAPLFEVRVDGLTAAERGLAGKPAPDTFLEAARLLAVEPSRAVVIEDAASGVTAGRSGGFGLVVGVAREGGQADLREHGADMVVADLAELEVTDDNHEA
jgi:beta-phosphoglucomutase-like phosphatase (HAD superfamily)